ncbi:MAG: carbohydrate kinase family protein [Candidatus Sungbacteria bacterium]|nr:carbohydrate kinase family protein [Candidatus Sungbacteria bacterium]
MTKYDFIGIGDTAVDAFIRLKEASVHCTLDHEKCEICLKFADKIPYEDVYRIPAVGNAANASVSAARLGLKSAFVSNVGGDYYGGECKRVLEQEGVASEFVREHAGQKTNYHYVLWYEDDRTILIKHEEYKYKLPDIGEPKWVYLSSTAENSLEFHGEIEKYLNLHQSIKLAFQPGTYQMRFGKEKLAEFYRRAEVFFCNKEESQRILKTTEDDIKKLLKAMADLGPKIVVITDGKKGAYAYDGLTSLTTGGEFWFMPPYPDPKPPLERTGAGDAFSSTFTAALALDLDVPTALRWGPINSMSVVQYVGAREGLLTREKLEEYLKNAPKDYVPRKI